MMKAQTTKEKVKSLRMDERLFKRIEKVHARYRPYCKSQNYFIIELIEMGLDQLEKESKIYGGEKK